MLATVPERETIRPGIAVGVSAVRQRREVYPESYVHERLADIAIDIYAAACTLARLDHLLTTGNGDARQLKAEVTAGKYFLRLADRRIGRNFELLKDNDDAITTAAAERCPRCNLGSHEKWPGQPPRPNDFELINRFKPGTAFANAVRVQSHSQRDTASQNRATRLWPALRAQATRIVGTARLRVIVASTVAPLYCPPSRPRKPALNVSSDNAME